MDMMAAGKDGGGAEAWNVRGMDAGPCGLQTRGEGDWLDKGAKRMPRRRGRLLRTVPRQAGARHRKRGNKLSFGSGSSTMAYRKSWGGDGMGIVKTSLALVAACGVLAACAQPSEPRAGMGARASLYERLGGLPAIEAVADKLIEKTAGDERTKRSFEGADLGRLKKSVAQLLCQGSGGPCVYKGDSMKEAHKGMAVSGAEFALMAGFAEQAMRELGVAEGERAEVMGMLGPMKTDIVEKP